MEKVKKLPGKINFFNFAKKEVKINEDYKISDLSRLSEIANNENDNLEVDLSFHLENGKIPLPNKPGLGIKVDEEKLKK